MRKIYQVAFSSVFAASMLACGSSGHAHGSGSDQEQAGDSPAFSEGRCIPATNIRALDMQQAATCDSTYGGHGTLVRGTVDIRLLRLDVNLVATGELPSSGGIKRDQLLGIAAIDNAITSSTASAVTAGYENRAASEAEVEELHIHLPLLSVDADVIKSRSEAACGESSRGFSQIANLRVNGLPLVVQGLPNEHLVSGIVDLVINEQTATANGIRTNALHIRALGIADLIVGQSEASVSCSCDAGTTPEPSDPNGPSDPNVPSTNDPSDSGSPIGSALDPWVARLGTKCGDDDTCGSGYICVGLDVTVR